MDEVRKQSFRESLEQHYSWPALYTFKFIVPRGKEEELRVLFPRHEISEKESAGGKYISLTIRMMVNSSEAVILVYERVQNIEGIISL
jgi:hypothetical protein